MNQSPAATPAAKTLKSLWSRGRAPAAADADAAGVAPAGHVADGGHALRILSGLHVGASRPMAEKEMILIGSGEDCDIVLSDPGVAPHHVLIGLLGGSFSVRALDAPLRIGGQPLHPGDPVELSTLQRIELGQAALAVGAVSDPAWSSLLPAHDGSRPAPAPAPYMKRLPAVAAFAVLSLMSVAILAAVIPRQQQKPQPRDSLTQLISEFDIADGRVSVNANGIPALSGTVKDGATRERVRQRLDEEGISASLSLRSGEDIAEDVRETLRAQGIVARTRYLGKGDVEVSGNFSASDKSLMDAAYSRTMQEVAGVRRIVPHDYAPIDPFQTIAKPGASAKPAEPQIAVTLVSVVRGKDPYVLGSDGTRFVVGDTLPDGSKLSFIGSGDPLALDSAGSVKRVELAPPPSTEAAQATTVAVGVDAKPAPPAAASAGAAPAAKAPAATPAAPPVQPPAAPQPQTVAKARPAQRM